MNEFPTNTAGHAVEGVQTMALDGSGIAQPISAANPLPVVLAGEPTVNIGIITIADGGDATQGAKADTRGTWYTDAVSLIALMKLAIATFVGAGSHAYGYTLGVLTTDAWTLLGTTRTKTYTYVAGVLTAETDWV